MQCLSGECIDRKLTCNGQLDCADGTDETVELCSAEYCPKFTLRCGYGGCIKKTVICNGVRDCRDGSDEVWGLCNTTRRIDENSAGNVTVVTLAPPTTTALDRTKCDVPADYTNIIAKTFSNRIIEAGSKVEPASFIRLSCQPSYNLVGATSLVCTENGWNYKVPICTSRFRRFAVIIRIFNIIAVSFAKPEYRNVI